jgi:hypothetical protein
VGLDGLHVRGSGDRRRSRGRRPGGRAPGRRGDANCRRRARRRGGAGRGRARPRRRRRLRSRRSRRHRRLRRDRMNGRPRGRPGRRSDDRRRGCRRARARIVGRGRGRCRRNRRRRDLACRRRCCCRHRCGRGCCGRRCCRRRRRRRDRHGWIRARCRVRGRTLSVDRRGRRWSACFHVGSRIGGLGDRAGRGNSAIRQQRQRIDVALILVCVTDAELDVGTVHLGVAARADRPDAVALGDRRALGNRDRPQLRERHRPLVRGQDRHRLAAARNRAGEGDHPGSRSEHRLPRLTADVDSPMLASRVRVCRVERERKEDRPVRRPRPRSCRPDGDQRGRENEEHEDPMHDTHLCHRCQNGKRSEQR